jgi:hypothetical protein
MPRSNSFFRDLAIYSPDFAMDARVSERDADLRAGQRGSRQHFDDVNAGSGIAKTEVGQANVDERWPTICRSFLI